LLDLLKRYGVKATFFVTGSGSNGELWRMYKEGHSIGMHTMTHDYDSIYASEEAFFNDLYAIQDVIYRNTGLKPTLMRFPGGGSNLVSSKNEGIMTRLAQAVQDSGFQYFDWNVDSNDAGGAVQRKTVAANVIDGISKNRVSVVLQHDIHGYSVAAVEDIIIWGLENGYRFLPLTETSPTMHHTVLN
jgi:peptidoglycan/xylan/chitin deacetylase (PgdA/CDA1 family)